MNGHKYEKAKMIAYLAMLIGSTALIPQIYKAVKLQKADEISLAWLVMGLISNILWIFYAWQNKLPAQAIATVLGSIPLVTLIVLKHTLPDSNVTVGSHQEHYENFKN